MSFPFLCTARSIGLSISLSQSVILCCVRSPSGFSSIRFSTVVIDEATQATEAAALVPIIRGCQQLILVGDQNQVRVVLGIPPPPPEDNLPPWWTVPAFLRFTAVFWYCRFSTEVTTAKKCSTSTACRQNKTRRTGMPPKKWQVLVVFDAGPCLGVLLYCSVRVLPCFQPSPVWTAIAL